MRRNIEFETENKEIYLGLILVRFFYRLDKKLLAKIKITLKNKNENKEDLREVREHIQDEITKNEAFMQQYGYLMNEGYKMQIMSYLFRIYVSLAIIELKNYDASYFEMLNAARTSGIKQDGIIRKGLDWILKTGFVVKYVFINPGLLLLLITLLKQLRKEGSVKDNERYNSIKKEYEIASKISNLFKELTKQQYENITNNFCVFKMDAEGRCYYDLKTEKIYCDDMTPKNEA
ncbi:TPA: hypothetical protein HA246_03745 [Candidatus Woesearchaeota archaeon]|nr:hypothetical protein [Candidatus Woesearchaeota archaeon]